MAAIARLLPLTPGVEALRKTLLDGASLATLATDGTLLWLVGNTVVYLVLGVAIFRWCERLAKRRGTLGRY
jgi:ABC-type polysaccharide/polyol phosphate export permease